MAIQINTEDNFSRQDDLLIIVGKKSSPKSYSVLASHKTVIQEKIDAGKIDFLTFYEGKRRVHVAVFADKDKSVSYHLENLRSFGSKVYRFLVKEKYVSIQISGLKELFSRTENLAFLEGFRLTSYSFNKYKSKKKENPSLQGIIIEKNCVAAKDLKELSLVMEAIDVTKNMVNEPVITLTAEKFSEEMVRQGKKCGFQVEVLNKSQIEALNMGGLLGVNKGSQDPPTFNIMTYKPANAVNSKPLVLVGKGVVFDTGGYSLKVGGSMITMKCDMAGGAAVLGAMMAISSNQLPLHVIGLVPATDNKINSNALVLDDIITMHDGTTVEIHNTDAEGRLILADALSFASRYKPMLVIDLATLTGAAAAVTGPYGIGMMGNDYDYRQELIDAGEETYERLVEFPFWREFEDLLKSDIADMKNVGGPSGGASTAGKFLEHFTSYNWLHLDIAGPAFLREAKDHHHKGATASGVRLLYNFAKRLVKKSK